MTGDQAGFEWLLSGEAAARVNSLGRSAPGRETGLIRHSSAGGAPLAGLEEAAGPFKFRGLPPSAANSCRRLRG